MAIVKSLQNVGGSRSVTLPKAFLDQLGIDDRSDVELAIERDRIVITRCKTRRHIDASKFKAAANAAVARRSKALKILA